MISDTIPKLGRIMMYTSGCLNIQNRFCHRTVTALRGVEEGGVEETVEHQQEQSHGDHRKANTSSTCVTNAIQVNTGMRMRVSAR